MLKHIQKLLSLGLILTLLLSVFSVDGVWAQSSTNPQSGAAGLTGTVPTDPPTQGATITFPGNGQTFTSSDTTVTGVFPQGLLVKLFKNEVFAGSAVCDDGSFTITIDLFSGANELVARVFDDLDQPGPDSNKPVVTFDDSGGNQPLDRVLLTSNFAKRGANPGQTLTWPLTITGGQGPYAVSVNWGDGEETLLSLDQAGNFSIEHIYGTAGTYRLIVRATDANGTTSFLQLVAVANGAVQDTPVAVGSGEDGASITPSGGTSLQFIVWPLYIMLFLIISTFWLGRRYEIKKLKKKLSSHQSLS